MTKKQKDKEWNDDGFMIRLPTYNECFEQFVIFLGLDCDDVESKAYKMNRVQDFYKLGDIYTNYYYSKILEVFDCKDENSKKHEFITSNMVTFESLVRFTTTKNYYSIASNKRAIWGILNLYYIPFLACAISSYDKKFKLPNAITLNYFILINSDGSQNISPIDKLKVYLKNIINDLSIKKDSNEDNEQYKFLKSSVDRLGEENKIPRYQTGHKILRYLKRYGVSEEKILEVSLIFRASIFFGHIYSKLCNLFGVENTVALFEYFIACFNECNKIQSNLRYSRNDFTGFMNFVNDYYNYEILYTLMERNSVINIVKRPKKNKNNSNKKTKIASLKKVLNKRNENRDELFSVFNLFITATKINKKDALEFVDQNDTNIGFLKYIRLTGLDSYSNHIDTWDEGNIEIVDLISQLEWNLTVNEDHSTVNDIYVLKKDKITLLFKKIQNHRLFNYYYHEYLYYSALNDLAENKFSDALDKLNNVAKLCKQITAGETLLKTAKMLISLTFLTNPKITYSKSGANNYSHLNSYVDMIIASEPEQISYSLITPNDELIVVNPDKKEISQSIKVSDNFDENQFNRDIIKQIYFSKIIRVLIDFNKVGYCCYEKFICQKYNPFVKLECLICQFYKLYASITQEFESEEQKINTILKQVIKYIKPKFIIQDDNLVTLYQYKAVDVFNYSNFTDICFFCVESQLNCENILKLGADQEMLSIIHKMAQDLSKKREQKKI